MRSIDDKKQIATALTALCEIHGKNLSPIALNIYAKVLENFTADQITATITRAIRQLKFFPKPTELIELMDNTQKVADVALLQADEIITHLRIYGATVSPPAIDPITHYLMTYRWPYHYWAKNVLEKNLPWWIKDFCTAYKTHTETPLMITEHHEKIKELTQNITKRIE